MSLKAKVESILFLADKPMKAQAIAVIVNEDVQVVRQTILELVHEYETRNGALEIGHDGGYIIQVKDEYSSIIDEFAPLEMPMSLLRTLSAIAIKQPVPQSEIIKIRGAGAYDHIKELAERDLIQKKEEGGRSPLLYTTKHFQDYFRLTHDGSSLRHQLRKEDRAKALEEAASEENKDRTADEVLQLAFRDALIAASESTAEPSQPIETPPNLEDLYNSSPDAHSTFTPPESAAGNQAHMTASPNLITEA